MSANKNTDSGVGHSTSEDSDVSMATGSVDMETVSSQQHSGDHSDVIVFGTDLDLPGIDTLSDIIHLFLRIRKSGSS